VTCLPLLTQDVETLAMVKTNALSCTLALDPGFPLPLVALSEVTLGQTCQEETLGLTYPGLRLHAVGQGRLLSPRCTETRD